MASIRETASGYEVLYRVPAHSQKCKPGCKKSVHQRSRSFKVGREAEQFARDIETGHAVMTALGVEPGEVASRVPEQTFREAAGDLIQRGGPSGVWKRGTQKMYASILNAHLRDLWPLTVAQVAQDRAGVERVVRKSSRGQHALALIHAVMRDAINHGRLSSHRLADIAAESKSGRRDIILADDAQLATIARELDDRLPGLGLTVYLGAWCGLRVGEALAVEGADFREDYAVLRVSRQVQDGEACPLKSKNRGAFRDVPVPGHVAERVRKHVAELGHDGRLFSYRGGYVPHDHHRYYFAKGARKAGLPGQFTSHMLRHRFATTLLSAGSPVMNVAEYMGHSTTQMLQVYSHVMPSSMDRDRAVLESAA